MNTSLFKLYGELERWQVVHKEIGNSFYYISQPLGKQWKWMKLSFFEVENPLFVLFTFVTRSPHTVPQIKIGLSKTFPFCLTMWVTIVKLSTNQKPIRIIKRLNSKLSCLVYGKDCIDSEYCITRTSDSTLQRWHGEKLTTLW